MAVRDGAVLRVRPKAMTVAVIVAGLVPIMSGHGSGSEVMSRIAAPMVGGMVSAPLLSLFVLPAVYLMLRMSQTTAGLISMARATLNLPDAGRCTAGIVVILSLLGV